MAIIYGMCVMFCAQRSWLAEYCSTQVCVNLGPQKVNARLYVQLWKKLSICLWDGRKTILDSWQTSRASQIKKGSWNIPRHESNITNYLYSYSKNDYWAFSYMQQPIVWSLFSVCWAKHHKLTQLKQVLRRIQKQWLKQGLFEAYMPVLLVVRHLVCA